MTKSSRPLLRAAMPVASIAFALAGIVQLRAQLWVTGGVCVSAAVVGFMTSMRVLEKTPLTEDEMEALQPLTVPVIMWGIIASLISISVVHVADNFKSPETDRIAAIAWVAGVILSLLVTWREVFRLKVAQSLLQIWQVHRREMIVLLGIMAVAFALRTVGLTTHPYPWSGDELSVGIEGRRILQGDITNFFETSWSSQPNWSFVPTALTEALFGEGILAIRIPAAVAGALAVLFLYLAARELFNPTIAAVAGVILAALPYHLHFSRVGVHNVNDSLMSALVFWMLARGHQRDDPRWFFSAGSAAGLCIYTYAGTRLALILGVVTLIFYVLQDRKFLSTHWKHVTAFAVAGLVSAAPQAAFFARHPDIFLGRFGQESILLNGWLTQQAAYSGRSELSILFDQFTRTFLVFISSPAIGNFFNSPHPYLTLLGSIFFLLGMGSALAFLWEPKYFIILLWFWSVIFFGGILTLNPPANTRMLMTAPPVALFIALGMDKVLGYLQRLKLMPERMVLPSMIVLAGILFYQNASFYMGQYRTKMYFQDANGEFAMEAGLMANMLGSEYQIYLLGAPRIFTGFPTFGFLAPDHQKWDLVAESVAPLGLPAGQKAVFFAGPENQIALHEIRKKFPGGIQGIMLRKPKPDEILFEYYILSP